MLEKPADTTAAKIRNAAMDLLTGREFSSAELATKLNKRFDNHPSVDEVLVRLSEEGLQSDKRFAEAFVRSRLTAVMVLLVFVRIFDPKGSVMSWSPERWKRPI